VIVPITTREVEHISTQYKRNQHHGERLMKNL